MSEGTNEPVRCDMCNTDFRSMDDFKRHAIEDHPDVPAKLATPEKAHDNMQ